MQTLEVEDFDSRKNVAAQHHENVAPNDLSFDEISLNIMQIESDSRKYPCF
jgi:hypothetical protein